MSQSISGSMSYTPPGSDASAPGGEAGGDHVSAIGDALDDMLDELSGDIEVADPVSSCPCNLPVCEEPTLKSIHIDFGWTFSGAAPSGSYHLSLAGQNFAGPMVAGGIRIDRELFSLSGDGRLEIQIEDGPVLWAEVSLDLPAIQTELGVVRRLTNLGWHAGEETFDERAAWGVRAFKRVVINRHLRGANTIESHETDPGFLASLQTAYGAHPDDDLAAGVSLAMIEQGFSDCQLFGPRTLLRKSYEVANAADDVDPGASSGVWGGEATVGMEMPIAGPYRLFLRAFDPDAGDPVIPNRIHLPQPVLMAKFVLWELGFWVVGGAPAWTNIMGTSTRLGYMPVGSFDRDLQWAVREFQCYAKSDTAARERTSIAERRYIRRLLDESPRAVVGTARYPDDGRVSGALNESTRQALQAWADQRLRCPVVIYSSPDRSNPVANGSDLGRVYKENLWLHDEDPDEDVANPANNRWMYCLNWSALYAIPPRHGGVVNVPSGTFPRPIVIGRYESEMHGGPVTLPLRRDTQCWLADTEVTPANLIGAGGLDGTGLSAEHLAWFKVVRTAAHFECLGYFDVLNAWDDVGISFGTCHWTAARTHGNLQRDSLRELPAFLAYFRFVAPGPYQLTFGRFGIFPADTWPLPIVAATRNYLSHINMQTESGICNMAGVGGRDEDRRHNNRYCKTWHSYFRYQMACRLSVELQHAQWDMTRIRVRDIRATSYTINGINVLVSDVATSEKAAAMLLRWHIRNPPSMLDVNQRLRGVMEVVLGNHPVATQDREDELIDRIEVASRPFAGNHLEIIMNSPVVVTDQRWGHQLDPNLPLSDQLDSLPALTVI